MVSREPQYFELPGGGFLTLNRLGFNRAMKHWSQEPLLYAWDMHNAPKSWPSVVQFRLIWDANGPDGVKVVSQSVPDTIEEAKQRIALLETYQ